MEVTDLMVGDLVIKHTATRGDMVCTVTPCIINSYEFDWSPIPITEEIIAKNGFVRQDDLRAFSFIKNNPYGGHYWYEISIQARLSDEDEIMWDELFFKIQTCNASVNLASKRYIHDLQHALRLVGLKDVANKLIVE